VKALAIKKRKLDRARRDEADKVIRGELAKCTLAKPKEGETPSTAVPGCDNAPAPRLAADIDAIAEKHYQKQLKDYCDAIAAANEDAPASKYRIEPACDASREPLKTLDLKKKELVEKAEDAWLKKFETWLTISGRNGSCNLDSQSAAGVVLGCVRSADAKSSEDDADLAGLFELNVTLTEIRQPSKFGLFLSETFSASKPKIVEALKEELPEARKARAEAAKAEAEAAVATAAANVEAARDARVAYSLAELDVESAAIALAEAPNAAAQSKARRALIAAKAAANKAFRKANPDYESEGRKIPYPEAD
jgi:hypothetical protein